MPDDLLQRLPPPFEPWERLVERLAELNYSRGLREVVDKELALVDPTLLSGLPQLRRANLLVGMLVQSYVNGETVPWETLRGRPCTAAMAAAPKGKGVGAACPVLPPQLAIPWHHICKALDLPHILCAAVSAPTHPPRPAPARRAPPAREPCLAPS